MPIPLVNSIASWFLKKRFHQIELFLKYPIEVQEELLHSLLYKAKNTEIGKKYDFASIKSYAQFTRHVPITDYEENENHIERARRGESNIFGQPQLNGLRNRVGPPVLKANLYL